MSGDVTLLAAGLCILRRFAPESLSFFFSVKDAVNFVLHPALADAASAAPSANADAASGPGAGAGAGAGVGTSTGTGTGSEGGAVAEGDAVPAIAIVTDAESDKRTASRRVRSKEA